MNLLLDCTVCLISYKQKCHLSQQFVHFEFLQVQYLGAIGGKDVAETTRRILRSLMMNYVARRMNFAGRGSKTGISDFRILDVNRYEKPSLI